MEGWLSRMSPVGTTQDVLEAQIREQKVKFRACIHVYSQSCVAQFQHFSLRFVALKPDLKTFYAAPNSFFR